VKHIPDFIKSQPLHLVAPRKLLQEAVQIFRSIPESSQVFAQHNDDVRADFLCFADELQLVQASTASFIIAGYNDLFLLDRQRQRLERGILILDYGCIETVIVLPAAAPLAVCANARPAQRANTDEMDNDSRICSPRPGSHLSPAKLHPSALSRWWGLFAFDTSGRAAQAWQTGQA
jgi:hypothetical protein